MKKLLLFPLFIVNSYLLGPEMLPLPKVEKIEPINLEPIEQPKLVQALIMVESSGNDSAYNASEDAVGCLQIRRVMVKDINRILKKQGEDKHFKLKDRWDCDKAVEMFEIYTDYYHPNSTDEVIARNWNGGPRGYEKESTIKYWNKVKGKL